LDERQRKRVTGRKALQKKKGNLSLHEIAKPISARGREGDRGEKNQNHLGRNCGKYFFAPKKKWGEGAKRKGNVGKKKKSPAGQGGAHRIRERGKMLLQERGFARQRKRFRREENAPFTQKKGGHHPNQGDLLGLTRKGVWGPRGKGSPKGGD